MPEFLPYLQTILSILKMLFEGLTYTVLIFMLTLCFSIPLGLVVTKLRMSKNVVISFIIRVYISIMRGTPLMLQLLVWYYGPYYIFGIRLSDLSIGPVDYRFIATIIGFSFNYAAYFGEIFRSGIQSMPQGQYEAGTVLGFTKYQTFFKIILPQVFKRVLPAVTNEVITLVKDTSLAQVIAVSEMFVIAKSLASAQVSVMPFIVAGFIYYVLNGVIEILMNRLEKRMSYYSL